MKRFLPLLLIALAAPCGANWQATGFNQFGAPIGCGGSGNVLLSNGDCTTAWGTVPAAQLPASVTLQGNNFNGAGQLVQLGADSSVSFSSMSVTGQLNVLNGTYSGSLDTVVVQSSGTGAAVNITNNGTGAALKITAKGTTSASSSVGGAFNFTNTKNDGIGAAFYTNHGAGATGALFTVTCDSNTFDQGCISVVSSGTSNTTTINYKGSSNNASALNVTSINPNFSAMQITGSETGKGTLKITHTGKSDGSDGNAAALSLDMQTAGTNAQGLFIDATNGGTTGALITLQNNGVRLGKIDKNGLYLTSVSTASSYSMWASTSSTTYQLAVTTSGHVTADGPAPVLTSCGSGSPAIVGDDFGGYITFGTAATGCTATFNTRFAARPACTITPETQSVVNALTVTISATSMVLSEASSAGLLFDYVCVGKKE